MDMQSAKVVSLSETDRNFSKIARLVELYGSAVVALNDKPRYLVLDLTRDADAIEYASDEEVAQISRRLMEERREVYEALAK